MMIGTPGLPGLDLDGRTALAGVRKGLSGFAGLGEPNRESHPEIVALAQKNLIAKGYKATCQETITPVPGGTGYYSRQCSVNGSGYIFSADYIPRDLNDEWGWKSFDVELRRELGLDPTPISSQWAQTTPTATAPAVDPRTKGGTTSGGVAVSFVPPTYTPPPPPPPPPATQKPQEKPVTQQPGEVPANTTTGTADKMAQGAKDTAAANATDEGFFSSSVEIGGMKIPMILLLAGAGVGLFMLNKGGK